MASQEVTLRLADYRDLKIVAEMSRDLIETNLGWTWTPVRIARTLGNGDANLLIAEAPEASGRGRIAGFAMMCYNEELAHLNLLAVDPKYRGQGLGKRLVQWLERTALTAGIEQVVLEVRLANRGGQRFYERMGYGSLGIMRGYYGGRESAVRMSRRLCEEGQQQPDAYWSKCVEDLLSSLAG